jgi:hypothetical protein
VQPRWSRSTPELYYRSGRQMMSVRMSVASGGPTFGKPTPVFDDEYDYGGVISIANYDTTLDGRFIMLRHEAMSGKLRVVVNWTEELKRILAAGGVH